MKKFKAGDKVIVVNNGEQYTTHPEAKKFGCKNYAHGKTLKNGTIAEFCNYVTGNDMVVILSNKKHYLINLIGIKSASIHHLQIKPITRTRAGKKYFTWQMSKGKKILNHQYNSKQTRDKQLKKMIEDFITGNYEIVKQ